MDLTAWALYLFIAAVLIAGAFLHYRIREPPGTGRPVLALLRGLALAVLVLLLFNPAVPVRGPAPNVVGVVDGSLSMAMPDSGGRTAWAAAGDAAADAVADPVLVFGGSGAPDVRSPEELREVGPTAPGSQLAPALRAAVESGADQVVVWTDGAVEDALETRRLLGTLDGVSLRVVGTPRAFNAGITALEAPGWVEADETVTVRATVGRVGVGGPDTVEVGLSVGEAVVDTRRVATPPDGGRVTATLRFRPSKGAGEPVRLDVSLVTGGGSMPDDDRRSAYVHVAEEPAGVAVVSLRLDREPGFLIPVLGLATGLNVRGWARVSPGRWVGLGNVAGRVEDGAVVRTALEEAEVVVLHGVTDEAPAWVLEAMDRARVLVLPGDDGGGFGPRGLVPPLGPASPGDWYVASEVPPSPVAGLLAGTGTGLLPPLTALRSPEPDSGPAGSGGAVGEGSLEDGAWTPLMARLARRGPPEPVLLAVESGDRRLAVALADGYWRWAFAGDAERAFYRRFWAAMAGWLVEGTGREAKAVRPVARVVERDSAIRWVVPADADSARVRLVAVGDSVAVDTVLPAEESAEGRVVALPGAGPGHYRYTVSWGSGSGSGSDSGSGSGSVTVARYSPELTRRVRLESVESDGAGAPSGASPLRSTPWGYLAVLALVSAEWVLRRRWGLR